MKILVALFDKDGNLVEYQTLSPEEAIAFAGRFILLQGSDPDYRGVGATSGAVNFTPVREAGDPPPGPIGDDAMQRSHDYLCLCRDCDSVFSASYDEDQVSSPNVEFCPFCGSGSVGSPLEPGESPD